MHGKARQRGQSAPLRRLSDGVSAIFLQIIISLRFRAPTTSIHVNVNVRLPAPGSYIEVSSRQAL